MVNTDWDEQSLQSYLLTQIPEEKECEALLIRCMPSLWALVGYFAQWSFNTSSSSMTNLTFPVLLRAIAFLCGRYYVMFRCWSNGEDMRLNRTTDQPVMEYTFRALASSLPQEHKSGSTRDTAQESSQRDVLDVLCVTQPTLILRAQHRERRLSRDAMIPTADRLRPPTPSETSDLAILAPEETIIPLLELLIHLLDDTSKFKYSTTALKNKLEASRMEMQKVDQVSFDLFADQLDIYTYDSIALLFNTFTNPNSLRTGKAVNWSTGAEETLNIGSLR